MEYNKLWDKTSTQVFAISNHITSIHKLSKVLGTVRDTSEFRKKL